MLFWTASVLTEWHKQRKQALKHNSRLDQNGICIYLTCKKTIKNVKECLFWHRYDSGK